MNLNLKKGLGFLSVLSMAVFFAGCKKDSGAGQEKKAISVLPANAITNNMSQSFYVKNCGLATLPAPVAGNGSFIYPAGIILAVNQPAGETPVPSSILFGPNVTNPYVDHPFPKYTLTLQSDGNLVLYLTDTNTSLWNTQSAFTFPDNQKANNCYLILQSDGNLVLHQNANGTSREYWASHEVLCPGQQPPVLILQSDGNIVEEYPCAPIGNNTYGFLGNSGTGGGQHSNHPGSF